MIPATDRRRGLAAATALFAACTSTVTPPAHVDDPVLVFLLEEAMHTGIVLPPLDDGDEFVEFGFGEWGWYALGHDSWYHVFATVLWPTQGTLGRRTFGARTADELRARVRQAELSPIEVSAAKAAALRRRLQQQHDERREEALERPEYGQVFVPFDRSYWFAATCADVAAEWFVELGCDVGWAPIRTGLAAGAP